MDLIIMLFIGIACSVIVFLLAALVIFLAIPIGNDYCFKRYLREFSKKKNKEQPK
jgi:hypothetical protein